MRIVNRHLILLPLVIGLGLFLGWFYAFALLPICFIYYFFAICKITKELQIASSKLCIKESMINSAKSYNVFMLWVMLIFSILFVIVGFAVLTGILPYQGRLIGLLGIISFGVCSISSGYMIKNRKAKGDAKKNIEQTCPTTDGPSKP